MGDSSVETATIKAEIEKAKIVCQGFKDALAALAEKGQDGDIIKQVLKAQLKEYQTTQSKMETKLQLLESQDLPVPDSEPPSGSPDSGVEAEDEQKKCVYLIHAHEDEDVAKPIMEDLQKRGLQVMHPETDYKAGMDITENIQWWISKSSRVVAVLSKQAMKSFWVEKELLQTLASQFIKHKQLLIPILLDIDKDDLPLYLQDKHFIDARVAPYLGNPKALQDRVAKEICADDIPFIGRYEAGDIATGLAWSYYYGYLRLIIPQTSDRPEQPDKHGFEKRLMNSKYWKEEGAVKGNMSTRFIVLCPDSARCHPSLGNSDPRIKALAKDGRSDEGFIEPVFTSRGGTPKRPYKQGVYRITMDDGEEYLVVGEYATPLLSMYEMEEEGWSGLHGAEKLLQKKMFVKVLQEILYQTNNDKKVLLLSYDDTRVKDQKYPIADLLVETIKEEVAARRAQETGPKEE